MEKRDIQIECLLLAQAFETVWAYYSQSAGQLYADECRKMAIQFLESYQELGKIDPRVVDPKEIGFPTSNPSHVTEQIEQLSAWAKSSTPMYPYGDLFWSRDRLFGLLSRVKIFILQDMDIRKGPVMIWSSNEFFESARVIRWRGHLPRRALLFNPDEIVQQGSVTSTIAVVGDIRRSQDLMTYAENPEDFSQRMVQFIATTRQLVEKHAGFFDKFTGDGFLVYFNEAVCSAAKLNYVDCFLCFLKEEIAFAEPLFLDWARSIRKYPDTEPGLAIGADVGRVSFQDIHDHLVAVGDAIVWASRMASVAKSNEIIVNNLLHVLLESAPGIAFNERLGQTKAGEKFAAHAVLFSTMSPLAVA